MKYCEFCGTQLNDNGKCTCDEAVQKAAKTKKALRLGAIIGIPALVLVIIIAIVAGSAKIDPSSYLEDPVFSGFNTLGTASVTFDKDALIESLIGEMPENFLSEEASEWYQKYEAYSEGIQCEYPREGLSNGDTFTVTISVSGEAANKIKGTEKTYTVKGLTETETVDIFQHIDVEFSGFSGEASARVKKISDDEVVSECRFQIEPAYELKNGDEVTVSISNLNSLLQTFTVIPTEIAKTFTVSGLRSYASADNLPMDTIQEFAERYVTEVEIGVCSDVKLYGIYFMEEKDDAFMANHNELHILIYYDYYEDGEYCRTHYVPLIFEDIIADANGKVNLAYEDNVANLYFYIDIADYMAKFEEDYTITKIG